jgi:type IV secretory pathway VirB10-like protein
MRRKDSHFIHCIGRALSVVSAALVLGVPLIAAAQEAPRTATQAAPTAPPAGSREIPRPDELEPGVNTTAIAPSPAAPEAAPAAPSPGSAAEPKPAASSAAPTAATKESVPARASADSSAAKPSTARPGAGEKSARKGPDRIELDATDITGNRELPKVLYIVPWKRSDLGDVVGRPVNSLLDEVLQPLDRDVFQRENRYYDALKPEAGNAKAGAAQGSQSKP